MHKLSILCSVLAVIGASASASAAVTHKQSAVACSAYAGSMVESWGAYENTSTTAVGGLDCYAVKQSTRVSSGWIKVKDQHPNQDITCSVNHMVQSGSAIYYVGTETQSTSGYSSDWTLLTFGSQANTDTYGYYIIGCVIPPTYSGLRSAMGAYSITEP